MAMMMSVLQLAVEVEVDVGVIHRIVPSGSSTVTGTGFYRGSSAVPKYIDGRESARAIENHDAEGYILSCR